MKTYRGADVFIHVFLTLALVGGEWSASRSGRFTSGDRASGNHCKGGWVDPRAGLEAVEKILALPRPARSPLLYRLSYPGSHSEGTSQYNKRTEEHNMKFI
jgi:hypothetical protein